MADDFGAKFGEHCGRDIGQHFAGAVVTIGVEISGGEVGAVEWAVRVDIERFLGELFHHFINLVIEQELGVELTTKWIQAETTNVLLNESD